MKVRALRFVAWFVAWSMIDEWSEFDESNSAGNQMKVPRFVAWSWKIQAKGEEGKCCS